MVLVINGIGYNRVRINCGDEPVTLWGMWRGEILWSMELRMEMRTIRNQESGMKRGEFNAE
jgi:hypothetical protein